MSRTIATAIAAVLIAAGALGIAWLVSMIEVTL